MAERGCRRFNGLLYIRLYFRRNANYECNYTKNGGGKIKDATSIPSDVRQGKVFYNNDGRQIGNAYIPIKEIILIPEGTPYGGIGISSAKQITMSGLFNKLSQNGDNYSMNGIGNEYVSGFIVFFSKIINMPFSKLLKIRITDMDRSISANFLFSYAYAIKDGMYWFGFNYYENESYNGYIRMTNSNRPYLSQIVLKIQNNVLTEISLTGYETNNNELCEISNNLKIEVIGE